MVFFRTTRPETVLKVNLLLYDLIYAAVAAAILSGIKEMQFE